MPQPLVSVIVPAYNAAGFISRCVESITSQSYPELEILLLNDGSTDDTLAVCRKLAAADSRIRVVDKPNTGAAEPESSSRYRSYRTPSPSFRSRASVSGRCSTMQASARRAKNSMHWRSSPLRRPASGLHTAM